MKNVAVVLAGGIGQRMMDSGVVHLPKQFLEIAQTPIIVMTLSRIIESNLFTDICVVCHPEWEDYLRDLLNNHNLDLEMVHIVRGGKDRIASIENALDFFKLKKIKDDDIVVICDAVRPFITQEILNSAVNETKKHGATVAIVPTKDTMIVSVDGVATSMPDRACLFHGQAPDSFKFSILFNAIKNISEKDRKVISGTAQICHMQGIKIHTYPGDEKNIKITTVSDLFLAKAIHMEFYKQ